MEVYYKGEKIDEVLSNETAGCLICYDFFFEGTLESTPAKKYRFVADRYNYKVKFPGCCE